MLTRSTSERKRLMQDALEYLKWEIMKKGARITKCAKTSEGVMEIPGLIDGVAVVEIGQAAFADCSSLRRVVLPSTLEELAPYAFNQSVDLIVDDDM